MSDYCDCYREPSEIELMIESLKEKLEEDVNKEVKNELARLRKENAELHEYKRDILKLRAELNSKMREYEYQKSELASEVKRQRISELFEDCKIEYFTIATKRVYIDKCDKCDDNRRIHYKTPLGRDNYEKCVCDMYKKEHVVIPTLLYTLSFRHGKAEAYYMVQSTGRENEEYLSYKSNSMYGSRVIKDEEELKKLERSYGALFATEELAQMYCDLKNEEESKSMSRDFDEYDDMEVRMSDG